MKKDNIDKAYISPFDKFIYEFDATHPQSESQLCEANKHKRIAQLRDDAEIDNDNSIWEGF